MVLIPKIIVNDTKPNNTFWGNNCVTKTQIYLQIKLQMVQFKRHLTLFLQIIKGKKSKFYLTYLKTQFVSKNKTCHLTRSTNDPVLIVVHKIIGKDNKLNTLFCFVLKVHSDRTKRIHSAVSNITILFWNKKTNSCSIQDIIHIQPRYHR